MHITEFCGNRKTLLTLQSLQQRLPLEKSAEKFTLQPGLIEHVTERLIEQTSREISIKNPVLKRYVTEQLVEQIDPRIRNREIKLLNNHALLKAFAKDYIRECQRRLILRPILKRLTTILGDQTNIETQFKLILAMLREKFPLKPGYAGGNILNLLYQIKTELSGCDFSHLTIWQACLRGMNLSGADFRKTDLSGADLRETDLSNANLRETKLIGSNLRRAVLRGADFRKTDLSGADLRETDLREVVFSTADLIKTKFSNANLTGVKLYGTARDDWIIDGIQCDYVYWDEEGKEHTPKDRDFRPGEFEELYKQLPMFDYYFEQSFTPIDAVLMDKIVQEINTQNPEFELKLSTLDSRGQPHATFTVLRKETIEEAKQQVKNLYESRIVSLEGRQEQLMEMLAMLIDRPQIGELISGEVKQLANGKDIEQHSTKDREQKFEATTEILIKQQLEASEPQGKT